MTTRREGVRVIWINPRGVDWIFQSGWDGAGGHRKREMRSTARQWRVATVLFVAARVEGANRTRAEHLLLLLLSPPSPSCAPTEEPELSGMTCDGRKRERRGEGRRRGSKRVR